SSGSLKVTAAFEKEIEAAGLAGEVQVVKTGCMGLCSQGPIVVVQPGNYFYARITEDKVAKIVAEHIIGKKPVKELLYPETVADPAKVLAMAETNFYKKQLTLALRNCGHISPLHIEEYIARDGYEALWRCLNEKKPEEVVQTMIDSGLRGRGGAGFPTGKKWLLAAQQQETPKYVICNADEGDPGAFMDRSVLEGDPHVILEAMTIAGYATGSHHGYIYVRAEYPIAVQRLEIAIEQAHKLGVLGKNIFETGFDFDIELRLGAGAFVCGEGSALMTSIEGNRGEPRQKPPRSAEKGLFQKPSLLNNVETYANIPQIILKGADWFKAIGTPTSTGTKVFAVGGKINNTGLVEVPMGTTLREVVYDICGGIPNGGKFKAAQTGGPSGGCIPADHLDVKMDFDSLKKIGSMMGSGGLIVMDEHTCMVDIAKFFLEFTVDESCGKCVPCRIGTRRMLDILNKITMGQATMEDLEKLEELCSHIQQNSLCGLGQSAPNPVVSTLKYFRDEYIAHIVDKRCPAGVCKKLVRYTIDKTKCKGCTMCARNCPAVAISGSIRQPHEIDQVKCLKCGACMSNCKFGAISKG
ncbi:MAG: NADH-quinone oxidoreductase subunit NuoF, partial [Kiritimatiellae bacterium]|nr:NADH-quinone oxidoreductase subunit NuoF [Kiritimatiellia bacterium]